jgi:hypothetical protein
MWFTLAALQVRVGGRGRLNDKSRLQRDAAIAAERAAHAKQRDTLVAAHTAAMHGLRSELATERDTLLAELETERNTLVAIHDADMRAMRDTYAEERDALVATHTEERDALRRGLAVRAAELHAVSLARCSPQHTATWLPVAPQPARGRCTSRRLRPNWT